MFHFYILAVCDDDPHSAETCHADIVLNVLFESLKCDYKGTFVVLFYRSLLIYILTLNTDKSPEALHHDPHYM